MERKRKRKTGESFIEEQLGKKQRFETKKGAGQDGWTEFQRDKREFPGERDFKPTRHIVEEPEETGDQAIFNVIAQRALVGIEFVASSSGLEIRRDILLADKANKGRHRLAAMFLKRSISGDSIYRNLLYVHSAKELVDDVIELDDDDAVESGSVTYYRKEFTVHTAGILKRIAFICKAVGSGGTTFAYRVLNIATNPENREVKNFIYQNTGNSAPTVDSFAVDRNNDYPYGNKDNPRTNKVTVEIELNATGVSDWKWEVILSSEERIIDIPTTE